MGNTPSSSDTTRKQDCNYDSSELARPSVTWQVTMDPPPPYTPTAENNLPRLPSSVSPHDTYADRTTFVNTSMYSNRYLNQYSLPHHHTSNSLGNLSDLIRTNNEAPGGGVGGFLSPNGPQFSTLTRSNSAAARTASTRSRPSSPAPSIASTRSERVVSNRMDPTRYEARQNAKEDAFLFLQKFDTVIILDDSTSMKGLLWREARDALAGIADKVARYNTNGIDLHFLNSPVVGKNLKSSKEVQQIFEKVVPRGITPTGEKLEELLLAYFDKLENRAQKPKPVNFVVLTDGVPTDDPETVIVTAAKRLDSLHAPLSQVGVQFVQLGCYKQAAIALKQMDDDLSKRYNIRDMVDTTLYSGKRVTTELLGKILLGGVNRRVDRNGFGCLLRQ